MLTIEHINAFYGDVQVLHDFSLELRRAEVLCLMGRNGAGKSTVLNAMMGLVRVASGRICLRDVELSALPAHLIPRQGVAYVPQGRRLFALLSVADNLTIGLLAGKRGAATLERVLDLFPILKTRWRQAAGTLSGGEQQMLAMARALCLEPDILLLDEPTEGLMPTMIARIRETVAFLKTRGVSTLVVEQRVDAVLPIADRVAFIENGYSRETLPIEALRDHPDLLQRYVGVGHAERGRRGHERGS